MSGSKAYADTDYSTRDTGIFGEEQEGKGVPKINFWKKMKLTIVNIYLLLLFLAVNTVSTV